MLKISTNLSAMKFMFYGDGDNEPEEKNISKLADELFATNLLLELLQNIKQFEFEVRRGGNNSERPDDVHDVTRTHVHAHTHAHDHAVSTLMSCSYL